MIDDHRPSAADVLRRAHFHIRRQKYREMCDVGDPVAALEYLQTEVTEVVDHTNAQESRDFRELTKFLFNWQSGGSALPGGSPGFSGSGTASGSEAGRGVGGLATGVGAGNAQSSGTEVGLNKGIQGKHRALLWSSGT